MKIENLEFKYVARVYSLVDGYPSTRDILFEIIEHLQETQMDSFTHQYIQAAISIKLGPESLKEKLAALVLDGYLSVDETEATRYSILLDPWEENVSNE